MLNEENHPQDFWGEVVTIYCYVLNMILTKRLDIVSEEIWPGQIRYVKGLRIFGSLCFKHTITKKKES